MTAHVICFPLDRKVGKARHVAYLYLKKRTDRERQSYWSTIVAGLENSMRKAGLGEAEISRQIDAFRAAVEWEIGTINTYNERGPGAA